MLQISYSIVGCIFILACSMYVIVSISEYLFEMFEKVRRPYQYWYWQKVLGELELSTKTYNPQVSFIAGRLKKCFSDGITGIDAWKLNDELEDKFGRAINTTSPRE